ncbi:MAG: energy transducer TonB [Rhodobacteraceae bacterium]|nr:energy transducer TonB [Paracoccaceae bacterium]
MMQRGILISGVGHGVAVLSVVFGGWLPVRQDAPAVDAAEVSLTSVAAFDAMIAPMPAAPGPAPDQALSPAADPAPPWPTPVLAATQPAPATDVAPRMAPPLPDTPAPPLAEPPPPAPDLVALPPDPLPPDVVPQLAAAPDPTPDTAQGALTAPLADPQVTADIGVLPPPPPAPVTKPKPKALAKLVAPATPPPPPKIAPPKTAPPKTAPPVPATRTAPVTQGSGRLADSAQVGPAGSAKASGPTAASLRRMKADWGAAIRARIERRKSYPAAAKGASGKVSLRLSISRAGQLTGASVAASSGNAALDQAALRAVRSAGRFPAAPKGLTDASYSFTLPITFSR